MVILTRMGIWRKWSELKSGITGTFPWITRTQSFPFLWQWTLQDHCVTNLFSSCSYIHTVKHQLWINRWQMNRISFVSLEFPVSLIWRVLLVWLWWKHRLCGLQSPLTSHLGLSYRFLVSFVRVVPHLFKVLPSYFFLRVLSKWHMMSVYFLQK